MKIRPTIAGVPLGADLLGHDLGSIEVSLDARWTMAFAAGVPDTDPCWFDTAAGVDVHPAFPVCPEWAFIVGRAIVPSTMHADEARRGIHAAHDLVLHRPLRADDRITLSAQVVGVGRGRAGAHQRTLFRAVDRDGQPLWDTLFTSLFLGVELAGTPADAPVDLPDDPLPARGEVLDRRASPVRNVDAHVYSECARIWNPIHTDVLAARAAGLAEPILHGTATMARAVSAAAEMMGAPAASVRRVQARFLAPVPLGTTLDIALVGRTDDAAAVEVRTASGDLALAGTCWFSAASRPSRSS